MNCLTVTNAVVIEYSKDEPQGFVEKENEYGNCVYFRILERNYNQPPAVWFCVGYDKIPKKISNMDLKPGDNISVSGKLIPYMDTEKRKTSFRFIVKDIDYLYCGMKEKKEKKNISEEKIQQEIVLIDLDKCEIFHKQI